MVPIHARRVIGQGMEKGVPDIFVEGIALFKNVEWTRTAEGIVGTGERLVELRGVPNHKDARYARDLFHSMQDIIDEWNAIKG